MTSRAEALVPFPLTPSSSGEWPIDRAVELAPDTLVFGKYRIKSVLGRGGFAIVYDAEHLALKRDVALKVLHRTHGMPEVLIERFAREVRISALVRHPNVLEVYDAGVLDDGSPFLVMEKIEGLTLHRQLSLVGRVDVPQCLELASQLLKALVAIGARGIVHRDIKPENLMLTRSESGALQLKLVDFGIALVHEERIARRLTMQGALIGTPHYMAPEQLRSEICDAKVDIYATGVVMYQVLTGVLPHDAEELSSLTYKVLNETSRPLRTLRPECPVRLARLVERALAREPERRFADASQMLLELEACQAACAAQALKASRQKGRAAWRSLARRRVWLPACAALLACVAQVGVSGAFGAREGNVFEPPLARATAARVVQRPQASRSDDSSPTMFSSSATPVSSTVVPRVEQSEAAPAALVRAPGVEQGEQPQASGREQEASTDGEAAAQRARARTLVRKGLVLYLHGELDAAYVMYRRASQLSPDDAEAFRGVGLAASRIGRAAEARRAFARYLELSPSAPDRAEIRVRVRALP